MAYRKPFIAALAGIILLASIWLIYEQVREPVISILICPEGTENNGNNICLCTDTHTITVTIDGIISCFPTVPEPDGPDVCDLVPEHPGCERAPKIPLDKELEKTQLPDDRYADVPGKFCKEHPNHPSCETGPIEPPGCGDQVECE